MRSFLNRDKHRIIILNKVQYVAFKAHQVPKRFAMTVDEIEKTFGVNTAIRSWINYKGFTLIEKSMVTGKDLQFVKFR